MSAPERYRNQDGQDSTWTPHAPGNVEDCEWGEVSGQPVHCGEPATWLEQQWAEDAGCTMIVHEQEWCDHHKQLWTADHERLPLQA